LGLQTAAHVIPLAMDIKKIEPSAAQEIRFKYDFKESIPVILFCSRVHCTKRLDLLIDALGDLLKKSNRFYFLVAGDGDPTYVLTMKKRVVKKGLDSITHFTGSLSGRDLDIAFQGSDIFVLPSYSENFSLATAEAMASGLPVIITDAIPLSADVSRYEAGFVVKPNQSALMDAIVILLSNHELRRKMGKNGRCLVRECYNSDKIVQQHVRLYQSIEKPSPASEP
jgi:glycosyltransferase involved in cell wall biosynthesis